MRSELMDGSHMLYVYADTFNDYVEFHAVGIEILKEERDLGAKPVHKFVRK